MALGLGALLSPFRGLMLYGALSFASLRGTSLFRCSGDGRTDLLIGDKEAFSPSQIID